MIRHSDALVVEPIDYELIWFGDDSNHPSVGSFRDFHSSVVPVWRVVSGYLGAAVSGSRIAVTSHGHPVGSIGFGPEKGSVSLLGKTSLDGRVLHAPDAGLALVRDAGSGDAWGFTLVHGPSAEKVSNRLALLDSLTRTGGRSG